MITENNLKCLLLDNTINNLLSNKLSCYAFLNKIGINTPKIFNRNVIEKSDLPLFSKPVICSGSKNSFKINNLDELKLLDNKTFLMQYIESKEYTVDCLFNNNGHCVGFNCRERVKTISGAATISKNLFIPQINDIIKLLEDNIKLVGPCNFQFFIKNNDLIVFDFNTRFASRGLPLSIKAGFDIPNKILEILLLGKTTNYKQSANTDDLTMIRYYEELFIND